MTKRLAFFTVSLAAAITLTGCSGESTPEGTESKAAETTTTQESENPVEGVLSAPEVEAIVSKLLEGDPAVQVIGNEQMQKELTAAKGVDMPNNIKPEKCAELHAEYLMPDLDASVSAVSTSGSETVVKAVEIYSLTDETTRKKVEQALTLKDLDGCETVTISQSGVDVEAERQILPLDLAAEHSQTMSTMIDAGGGQTLASVAIQALEGNNFVSVTLQTGSLQPAELAAEAAVLADEAIAEIKALD